MNQHGNHTATCLCCRYLWIEDEQPPYSDVTPGNPLSIACQKRHFRIDQAEGMHILLMQGQSCPDFEGREHK